MLATLGNIQFQNLKSFNDFNKTSGVTYAEHAILDGKPRLQKTGDALDTIELSMRFHVSFCKPAQEVNALRDALFKGEIMPLLWGNGALEGSFVITEITAQIEDTDDKGNIFAYNLNVSLKEYVSPDPIQDEQVENKKKATATGKKKPVAKKKVNDNTCAKHYSDIMMRIDNHNKAIETLMIQQGGGTITNYNQFLTHSGAMKPLTQEIYNAASFDTQSCVFKIEAAQNQSKQVLIQIGFFEKEVRALSFRQKNEQVVLSTKVQQLKTVLRPLINQAITRSA